MFSSELSSTFKRLAEDENSKVRRTVASGFHEVRREREGGMEGGMEEGGRERRGGGGGEEREREREKKREEGKKKERGERYETESLVSTAKISYFTGD